MTSNSSYSDCKDAHQIIIITDVYLSAINQYFVLFYSLDGRTTHDRFNCEVQCTQAKCQKLM